MILNLIQVIDNFKFPLLTQNSLMVNNVFFMIIVWYVVLIVLAGVLRAKYPENSRENFFVAGRKMNTFFVSSSLISTIIGGSSTIGLAGLAFQMGLVGAWWLLVGSVGLLILGLFFAKKVRSFGVFTLPELMEKQYDRKTGIAASILIVIAWIGIVAAQIVAAGKVLSLIGFNAETWMILFTLTFIIYAIIGGQNSIIRTDTIQAMILILGIFITLFTITLINRADFSLLPQEHFYFPINESFGIKDLFTFLIIVGSTYVVGPDIYTRLFCAKDEKTARNSALVTSVIIIPIAISIAIIGMSARINSPVSSPEQAFPFIIMNLLPIWLAGFVIAGLTAAFMSSADTCILSQSIILTEDLLKKALKRKIDERTSINLTRLNIFIMGSISLLLAISIKGVISSLLFAYTIFTCGLVVPLIAGFYKERLGVNSSGAIASLIGGGSIGLLGRLPGIDVPYKADLGLIGFFTSIILLFFVSRLITKFRNSTIQSSG